MGKFHGVRREIGSSMKSVGEVMAIGRTFEEAIQKGLRMTGRGMHGFVENKEVSRDNIELALKEPTDMRVFAIATALRHGFTVEQIHDLTKIDRWFLEKLRHIVETGKELEGYDKVEALPLDLFKRRNVRGFSDFQIGRALFGNAVNERSEELSDSVRIRRKELGIVPVVKQIDTLAAEYPAQTNYLYLTYNGSENDITYENDGKSVVGCSVRARIE